MADLPTSPPGSRGPGRPALTETLRLPWWWWPPVLGVAALLAAEVRLGYPGVLSWLPYVVLLPPAAALLWRSGRTVVGVRPGEDGEIEVVAGAAHMPVRWVGHMDVVVGESKQRAMGPELDPDAFVLHRPWIGPAVRIEVLDPDDPAPYWVVSTRRPQRLIAALREASRV